MSRPHDPIIDDDPSEAQYELVTVDDRARVPIRHVKVATAAAAIVVVALVGIDLLPAGEAMDELGAAGSLAPSSEPSSAPSSARSPSPAIGATRPDPFPHRGEIVPGRYAIDWPERSLEIRLTMPGGWWADHWGRGTTISRGDGAVGRYGTATLSIHDVARVVTDACAPAGPLMEVGPTVDDLAAALANMTGVQRSGPTDAMLGGHPAKRFAITLPDSCPGPETRPILESASGPGPPGLLKGGTATILIVDVDGDRVVITTLRRGSSADDISQLEAIVASIDIEKGPAVASPHESLPAGELAVGEHELIVDGVMLAFDVPTSGWISGGPARDGGWIHKGEPGAPGGAEIAFWSPDNVFADPCAGVPLSPPVGPSAADLAAAVANLPGTESSDPIDVTVGQTAAKLVVLTVPDDIACDAGSFRLWYEKLGATSSARAVGSTIRVWIIDSGREASPSPTSATAARVVIEGATGRGTSPELEREIEHIVGSISLCCG